MKETAKKVGYLKGLLEGMNFESDSANGRILHCIADLLGDLTDRADTLDEVIADLNDYVESIDDDLSALEDDAGNAPYDFLDEENDDYEDDDFEGGEDRLHLLRNDASDEPEDDNESLAGALCPKCSRMFFVSMSDPENSVYDCPHCAATITPIPLTPDNAPIARPKTEF